MGSSSFLDAGISDNGSSADGDQVRRRRTARPSAEMLTSSEPAKSGSAEGTAKGQESNSVTGAGQDKLVLEEKTDCFARWREWAYLAVYLRDAIVGPLYDPILSPRPEGTKRPVVLVPGWCGRTRSFRTLAERLQRAGHPVYPVPLGAQLGCIDRKAGLLTAFLDQHKLEDVYVVAHSMGGLITVRSMMKGEARIRKAITLGTPYRGTYLIYGGYCLSLVIAYAIWTSLAPLLSVVYLALFVTIPSLWQMMPKSTFLTEVLTFLGQTDRVQCVYALCDQVVIHNWRSLWAPTRLHRETDVCIPEWGHMNLFMGPSATEHVAQLLEHHEHHTHHTHHTTTVTLTTTEHRPVLVCKCCDE